MFGGTFDPPHVGHLVTAINVRHALDLDVVLLMVANVPWQKLGTRQITPAADRLAMVVAAVDGVAGLQPGDHEIRAGGPSFTADTLATFAEDDITLVLGADAALGLPTWERVDEVLGRARIAVMDRPGTDRAADRSGRARD